MRKCPLCKKNIFYKNKRSFLRAIRKNKNCKSCSQKGRVFSDEHKLKIKEKRKFQFPPKLGKPVSSKTKKILSDLYKNKTYEERYGKEKSIIIKEKQKRERSEETKQKLSDSHKGDKNYMFGKTFDEIYGEEKAKDLKRNHSLSISGKNNVIFGKTYEEYYGKERSQEILKKLRLQVIKRIGKKFEKGHQVIPFYNSKGCQYFDKIMKETKTFIQHAENGGEYHIKDIGYWVDGYDKDNNIVYEYDEKHHYNVDGSLKNKDVNRQREIEEYLKCKFIRVRDFNIQ